MIDIKAIRAVAEKIKTVDGFSEPEEFDYLFHQYGIETRPEVMFELLDRLESAEKDAARYVWWRDTACRNPSHVMRLLTPCVYSVEIDDAIDAAMKDGQK